MRVRGSGYGAGLDIGVDGSVKLGGSLAAPTLAGAFNSTGGTLTYFDRAFRVQQGSVQFNAADGVLPTLHAVASTSVVNPDPDRARNPYGSADVTIRVDGRVPDFKIDLSSNPPGYTREEILALIAPFGGFVSGIGFSRQSMLARQQPNGITPLGAVSPIPDVAISQRSTITVGQEAFNLLNAQFTAGLLSPFETTLSQGLGLSSINLTLGYYGNVGFTATRLLGKAVSAVYAVTFGIPQTQSFGLTVAPNPETSTTLSFFVQNGPTKLFATAELSDRVRSRLSRNRAVDRKHRLQSHLPATFLVNDPSIKRSFRLWRHARTPGKGGGTGRAGSDAMSSSVPAAAEAVRGPL